MDVRSRVGHVCDGRTSARISFDLDSLSGGPRPAAARVAEVAAMDKTDLKKTLDRSVRS